ncbi:MAG: hypothetical protein V3U56_12685 [Syntrophobacteria bacterium]
MRDKRSPMITYLSPAMFMLIGRIHSQDHLSVRGQRSLLGV